MWLLNVSTFELEEYFDNIPQYAILSHRWVGKEELSFADVGELKSVPVQQRCQKIISFCAMAQNAGYSHVWIDTCCIDKKSSAELSEAINSMYKLYQRAAICCAYLYDVTCPADLSDSSWFQRGWTLQELLAPREIHFYDCNWEPIGSRTSLAVDIEKITGIPAQALQSFRPADHCIAEKFSWSARRQTTREEDLAYCLLGLFEVNMPLLYGEGERAFQRLQEEIMKVSTDMSLFLWQGRACGTFGMLAADPSCYSSIWNAAWNTANIELFSLRKGWTVNNAGMSMEAQIEPYMLTEDFQGVFALRLNDTRFAALGLAIFLFREDYETGQGISTFARATVDGVAWKTSQTPSREASAAFGISVAQLALTRQPLVHVQTLGGTCGYTVIFRPQVPVKCTAFQRPADDPQTQFRDWHLVQEPSGTEHECSFSVSSRNATGLHGYVLIALAEDVQVLICLGLDGSFQPLCFMMPLCKRMCDEGFNSRCVLHAYRWNRPKTREIFVTDLHMIYLRGFHESLRAETTIGVTLDIDDSFSHGKFVARITFDIEEFIEYYLPTLDLREPGSAACTSRDNLEKLRKIESDLHPKRLKTFRAFTSR